ncbi:MAG: prepilin-type N-terminal cleavage/methylation domain-containing protein [Thermoanaerobaculia bacterium]|nr:prepilin-type N-terminal cleavage/methylation domain-containing protein [Thermoanaerobaculia bacterium]
MTSQRTVHQRERGFTLTEILVATAIFTIIMVAALLLYDRSNKVFKSGVEAADLQQNTRVAFDKMVADLRMAGFDFDRDGIPSGVGAGGVTLAQQPDEQIEFIAATAITIRGNFDHGDRPTVDDQGREFTTTAGNSGLETPEFPVVTTGNDEIVTYALVSVDRNTGLPIAANNTDSITFYADVPDRKARTGTGGRSENLVTIDGVDLTHDNPPYTLMRIPVALTATGAVAPVKIPIATGIRSMNFEYFTDQLGTVGLKDLTGAAILPANYATTVGGLGQYDPNSPTLIVPKVIRATIQSIKLTLVGMTEFPDPTYTDPTDAVAPTYRKYRLESLIVPRNTGRRGLREQDSTEPGLPVITTVCVGYCGVAFVAWDPPTTGGVVENYELYWDTSPTGTFLKHQTVFTGTNTYTDPLGDPTAQYYFKVQAVNSYGNRTSAVYPSAGAGFVPINLTKPYPPELPAVTGDGTIPPLANRIGIGWSVKLSPLPAAPTCVGTVPPPTSLPITELGRWSIKRMVENIDATDESLFLPAAGEDALLPSSPIPPDPTQKVTWLDETVANCFTYYYRLQSLEGCPASGVLNASDWVPLPAVAALRGRAESDALPDAPVELALGDAPASQCVGGICRAQLIWPKVKSDANGPVTIGKYIVRRNKIIVATGAPMNPSSFPEEVFTISLSDPKGADFSDPDKVVWTDDGTYDNDTYYSGPLDEPPGGHVWEYTVTAQQCASAESGRSPARRFPCAFTPTLDSYNVVGQIEGSGTAADPWLIEPTSSLELDFSASVTATARIFLGGVMVRDLGVQSGAALSWPLPDIADGTVYKVEASVIDANGCHRSFPFYVDQTSSNCCLVPFSVNANVITADAVSRTVRVKLQNVCNDELQLFGPIKIYWNTGYSGGARLDRVVYPAAMGACPTLVNSLNSAASPVDSVPPNGTARVASDSLPQVGLANCPDPANREYRFDVIFTKGFTESPISKICVSYRRYDVATGTYIDLANQICQIVPAPSATPNVCDP